MKKEKTKKIISNHHKIEYLINLISQKPIDLLKGGKEKLETLTKIKNIDQIYKNRISNFTKNSNSLNSYLREVSEKDFLKPQLIIQKLQDKIEQRLISKNNVLLKQPKFWAKSIIWVLMSGTGFGIAWLSLAKTDEVVLARGILEPIGGVVEVQMPLSGITKEILISEGEKVEEGQTLIRLDTDISSAENESIQKSIEINERILEKLQILSLEGAVSELQVLQQETKVIELKTQMKANLVKLKYQEIVSPIDGIVFELNPKGPGYVAQTSEPVLKIVPFKKLQAKVEIDSRTIGFVKAGKLAEISIDSFPGSDFGVIQGSVKSIGSDALVPNLSEGKGYRFPAEITLNNQYLKVKSGQKLPLQPGMSLTANIKLRKVSYLQLLLNKFSDKAKSIKSI